MGEALPPAEADPLRAISEKLEVINLQLAKRERAKTKTIRWVLIALCAGIVLLYAALGVMQSSYLGWDYGDPELAVAGTLLHGFEFVYVRVAPIVLLASGVGIVLTWRHRS